MSTLATACMALAAHGVLAQEVVHAAAGTVSGGPNKESLTIKEPDQTVEVFNLKNPSASVKLDKALREKTEAADKVSNTKTNVIVYYYGYAPETAVAVKDLGSDVHSLSGTVTHMDKSQHTIALHGDDGKDTICYFSAETTVNTGDGVTSGDKLGLKKGQKISVICTQSAGKDTAEFIEVPLQA